MSPEDHFEKAGASAARPSEARCANCGADVRGPFCYKCGRPTELPSTRATRELRAGVVAPPSVDRAALVAIILAIVAGVVAFTVPVLTIVLSLGFFVVAIFLAYRAARASEAGR